MSTRELASGVAVPIPTLPFTATNRLLVGAPGRMLNGVVVAVMSLTLNPNPPPSTSHVFGMTLASSKRNVIGPSLDACMLVSGALVPRPIRPFGLMTKL